LLGARGVPEPRSHHQRTVAASRAHKLARKGSSASRDLTNVLRELEREAGVLRRMIGRRQRPGD
jgi:hypothetical protein